MGDQNGDMFSSLRRLAQTGGMVPRSIRQSQRQLCTKPTKPKVEAAPELSPAGIGPGQHQNRTASRGPLGWASLSLAALVGGAFVFYFRKEKERLTQQRMGRTDSHGNPLLGGPFELFDGDGKIHKSEEYLGKYMLVYFGFTNCPDLPSRVRQDGHYCDQPRRYGGCGTTDGAAHLHHDRSDEGHP